MKEFDKAIITKNGNELIAEAIAGKKIEFTRLITGCGIYGESEELECAAALREEKQEFPFSVNEKISENGVLLTAVISNVGLESGYRLTEIGIGGKLQDSEEEILYAINITGEEKAYFLPPYNGLEATEIELSCYITIKQDAELKMALGDVVDMMLNELRKENARAITAEKELKGSLNILTENLAEEVTRATEAEEELKGNLNILTESFSEETTRATAAEEELKGNLSALTENLAEEVTRATVAEEELKGGLNTLTEGLKGFIPLLDDTGRITGYKTTVGADTVFPFKSSINNTVNEVLVFDYCSSITSSSYSPLTISSKIYARQPYSGAKLKEIILTKHVWPLAPEQIVESPLFLGSYNSENTVYFYVDLEYWDKISKSNKIIKQIFSFSGKNRDTKISIDENKYTLPQNVFEEMNSGWLYTNINFRLSRNYNIKINTVLGVKFIYE